MKGIQITIKSIDKKTLEEQHYFSLPLWLSKPFNLKKSICPTM